MGGNHTPHILVIGAGIGGLTSAALLIKAGFKVTVLEAHVYPGGSAGTFFHQGYQFDAGATLAGGFYDQGPHRQIEQILGIKFPVFPVDPAWVTHIGGCSIRQWQNSQQWLDEIEQKFPESKPFWQKQRVLAELSWKISSNYFPYPPQSMKELTSLLGAFDPHLLKAVPYLFAKVTDLIPQNNSPILKTFLDSQLIISAQTTTNRTNAIYGSAALDLPRRGVVYVPGGMGTISKLLVKWIKDQGGQVYFRQQVTQLEVKNQRVIAALTNKGERFEADYFIGNLTPFGLTKILYPERVFKPGLFEKKSNYWGAFVLYLGVDQKVLPADFATHHQVVINPMKPMGEGNSVFISISHPQDGARAPQGDLSITCSTHTNVSPWWSWAENNPDLYEVKKHEYTELVFRAVETVLPDIRRYTKLALPGTPRTFQKFTRRPFGFVGGFPQESLLRVRGPKTNLRNLCLVGDSVFPGQSTAAVTIGAQRVVKFVIDSLK